MADSPPVIRLYLLQHFRAARADGLIPDTAWRLRSAKALVKILASDASHARHRESIQEILWPTFTPDAAYNSFRKALHLARHALEPGLQPKAPSAYLRLNGGVVSLVQPSVWTDIDEFEVVARTALNSDDPTASEQALTLYAGELLPDERYAQWAETRRNELARLHLQVLMGLSRIYRRQGNYGGAADRLRQVLELDSIHEDAHRDLMRVYAESGRRHEALRQYQVVAETLLRELDVQPDQETRELHEQIQSGEIRGSRTRTAQSLAAIDTLPRAVRHLLISPLVDRIGALAMLRGELESSLSGVGTMVLVSGEAGVGKSRLIAELAHDAHMRGGIVLWGVEYQEEGLLPYGALVDAIESYLVGRPDDELRGIAARFPELTRLIPALPRNPVDPDTTPRGEGERMRLFASILHLIADIAADRPLLLVLEDLHATDPATLQLVHFLRRNAVRRPWAFVGSYREEDIGPNRDLRNFAQVVVRDRLCKHLELLRFARGDADDFVRSCLGQGNVSEALLQKLYNLSLGNPLFLQQLLDAMRETGRVAFHDETWQEYGADPMPVPSMVRELIESRLQRLSGDTQRALSLVATISVHATLALVRAASRLDEARLVDALDAAMATGLMEEGDGRYIIRNPLVREVMRDRLSSLRRASMHGAIAGAIQSLLPNAVEALALHFARAGLEEEALHYLELAGDRAAAVYAHDSAVAHYGEALDLILARGEPAAVARLQSKLGGVLVASARYGEALEILEQVAAHFAAAGDLESLVQTIARIAYAHSFRGTPDDGAARIQQVLSTREPELSGSARAQLYLHLGILHYFTGRYEEQLVASERASALYASLGDSVSQVEAESNRGLGHLLLGRVNEAVSIWEVAIPLAESCEAWSTLADLHGRIGVAALHAGNLDEARRRGDRVLELCDFLGDPMRKSIWGALPGMSAIFAGEWESARIFGEKSLAASQEADVHSFAPFPLVILSWVYLLRDKRRQASEMVSEGLAMAEATGNIEIKRLLARVGAELLLLEGRPGDALDMMTPLMDRNGWEEWDATILLPLLVWSHRDLGDAEAAWSICETSIVRAIRQNHNIALVDLLRLRAGLQFASGRIREAEADYRTSIEMARAMPYPLVEARGLAAWGDMLIATGDAARGQEYRRSARTIFQRLGAQHLC